jgi:hypothetical protein
MVLARLHLETASRAIIAMKAGTGFASSHKCASFKALKKF